MELWETETNVKIIGFHWWRRVPEGLSDRCLLFLKNDKKFTFTFTLEIEILIIKK